MKMRLYNLALVIGMLVTAVFLLEFSAMGANLGEIYPPPPQYVDIINGSFNPSSIAVPLNTTVVWSNHDNTSETVTSTNGSFDSGNISSNGYEYRYIFLKPGNYEYYSRVHPTIRGSVIVGNASVQVSSANIGLSANARTGMNASANTTIGASGNASGNTSKIPGNST
jgi:hypothetical protein